MPYNAGTVFLQVVPSYRGFQESVRRQAKEAAKAFKGEFENETGQKIADAIDKSAPSARKAAEKLGTDLGQRMGGKTHDAIQKKIKEAFRSLPTLEIKADSSKVTREVALVKARLAEIGDAHANFDLDSDSAFAQLASLEAVLIGVQRQIERGSELDIDTASAMASLTAVAAMGQAAGKDITINVDADTGAANAKLASTAVAAHHAGASGDDAANSFRAFNGVLLSAVALGPMLVPILAALAGGLAAIGPMAIAGAAGLGVLVLGLSGIPGAVGALNDVSKNGAKDALAAEKTMRSAANGIKDAERALARTREDAARSQADSARRVAAARRSLADAERQAADNIKDAVRREADARQNLRDVTQRVNREIEASERRVADASRNLSRAREDAARRNADAIDSIARAERRVVEAQSAALDAQEALTEARREAQDDLEDLALKAQGGVLAERQAILTLADAKKQYDRVMGREFKSARSVEEVTLAYEEAKLALERVRLENGRTAEELAEANAAGVEGSERVQTAQERLADAQQAQADAAAAVAEAEREAVQTRLDGIRAISDATRDQQEAQTALRQSERDGAREIRDAQEDIRRAAAEVRDVRAQAARDVADAERAVGDALRAQHRSAVDSARGIADAQRGLQDAQVAYQEALTSTGDIGSSSMQKLQEAMAALSPAGQDFARFIFGLKDEFLALRAAAEAGLLPGLQDFLENVIGVYGPGFTKWVGEMAKVAGGLFRTFGEMLTTNPLWREFFKTFGEISPKLFRQFGLTTINWLTIFVTLLEAFTPLAMKASGWLLKMSENVMKWAGGLEDTKGFQDFMGYLERVLPKVGEFFGALFLAIGNVMVAIAPFGELLLEVFTGILQWIAGMDPDTLGAIIFAIGTLVVALQAAYGIMTLMLVGITAFQVTIGIWVAVIVLVIAALVALYLKFDTFREIVNTVVDVYMAYFTTGWGLLIDFMKWGWENVLKPVFEAIGLAAVWLWEKVLSPTWEAMKVAWDLLVVAAKWAWENILKPVWDAISVAANWLWDHVLGPVFGFIKAGWSVLATTIKWVWDNIWYPVIELVTKIIWELWKLGFSVVFDLISKAWSALATAFKWVLDNVLAPAWEGLQIMLTWAWDHVIKPMLDSFMDVIGNDLVSVFETAVGFIKKHWDTLQDIAKAPIKFIVETVINDGLIGTFNKIADFFGTKQMGEIPLPKGFATGGYTGPGSRYQVAGVVHADEYVISAPARRAFESRNPGMLDAINSGRGYAKGGIVRPVNASYGLPYGNTYRDGSFHSGQDFPVPTGTPVFAAIAGLISQVLHLSKSYGNHVVMKHPGGAETLYAHLSNTLARVGQVVGAGTPIGLSGTSGNSTGPHLHFEFRTPPGGYGNAIDPRGLLGGAGSSDGGGFFPDWLTNPFGYLKGKVNGLLGKMGNNPFVNLASEIPRSLLGMAGDAIGGFGKNALGKAGDVFGSVTGALNPFGGAGDNAGLYDQGGVLPPGMTHVLNASRKPEAVLTNAQWAALERAADGGAGAPGLSIGDLYAVDPEDAVRKIRTSQQDAAALNNLRSIASGV